MHGTHQDQNASCNAARYYAEKIERLVVDALWHQLSKPNLIREYVKAYRDQRNRVEADARRRRSSLDREFAKAKTEIQRIVSSIAKGLITDIEAASLLLAP